MTLAELIARILYAGRMNQKQLGEEINLTQATISRIKLGQHYPRLSTVQELVKIAKRLKINVKLDDLEI